MVSCSRCETSTSLEHLLIDGYRGWSRGNSLNDPRYWEHSWNLYAVALGSERGRLAMDALSSFVKTLETCATCPLKTNPLGSHGVCRDEVLLIGLISGFQHEDETVTTLCLSELTCAARCEEVSLAAEALAVTFKTIGKQLKPIPPLTIMAVLSEGVSDYVMQ